MGTVQGRTEQLEQSENGDTTDRVVYPLGSAIVPEFLPCWQSNSLWKLTPYGRGCPDTRALCWI